MSSRTWWPHCAVPSAARAGEPIRELVLRMVRDGLFVELESALGEAKKTMIVLPPATCSMSWTACPDLVFTRRIIPVRM